MTSLGYRLVDVQNALQNTIAALEHYESAGMLDGVNTGNALHANIETGLPQEAEMIGEATAIFRPAANYGSRKARQTQRRLYGRQARHPAFAGEPVSPALLYS